MDEVLKINYEKYKLSNGLEVILYKDDSLPLVCVNLWYRVGSANESKGKTGFAHLFEHMMFQGSKNVPKQMHFKYIQEAGGNLNGSTSLDRTNYFQTVPSNYLELVLWLESDRMGYLLPALNQEKLANQIDVVSNERRQRYENAPYGLAWEILFSNLYPANHPYSWPTIGWMEDISNFKLEDIHNFFNTYYAPNNATLVIGGSFDSTLTKNLIERYFKLIPNGKATNNVTPVDFRLEKNIELVHYDNVQLPRLYLAWHTEKAYHKDDAFLEILSDVLSGTKNSRLHKSLVFEKEIAQQISTYQYSAKLDGTFIIIATAKPGFTLDELKTEIFIQLSEIFSTGITAHELQRAKNSIKSSFIYSIQNLDNLADRLNEYNFYLNEPDYFINDIKRYQIITTEEVTSAAKKYLTQPYVELRIIPKQS